MHPPALCFNAPISVKVTSSGDEGWDWEEGDWVWYPLEGLPGLGLALPEEPAYRITPPPPANKREGGVQQLISVVLAVRGYRVREFKLEGARVNNCIYARV